MASPLQTEPRRGVAAAVERQLESMSARDRKLLGGLVAFVSTAFLVGTWWSLSGILAARAADVRDANQKLAQIRLLQGELAEANATLEAQQARIQQSASQPVGAWVEKLATDAGVLGELRNVNETSAEVVGGLKQTHYKIELKKSQYDPMLAFLYGLESSGYPAQVELASIKTASGGKDKGKVYDLTLDVVVYSLEEGG
jgi:hypothetical protein